MNRNHYKGWTFSHKETHISIFDIATVDLCCRVTSSVVSHIASNNEIKQPEVMVFLQECVGKHIKEPLWYYFQKCVSAQRRKKIYMK